MGQLAANLLAVSGCGLLSAGKLIGETGRASRFRCLDAYARFNGTAPVPVHSGNREKMRLNRGGNRQVNTALHMIAVTQLRRGGPGADSVAKRQAAGDDKTEAVRLLRRRVSDAVFKAMLADERQRDDRDHCHSSSGLSYNQKLWMRGSEKRAAYPPRVREQRSPVAAGGEDTPDAESSR